MPFSSIIGHLSAVAALRRALESDQLAGTYLFVGPPGVGKTALAQAFAQSAACLRPQHKPFDACGECDSCRRAASSGQPEVVLISPAGDQTQIWQFWDRDGKPAGALQHTLPYAPSIGRRRVYIVERADTLNEATANSLLKVLEEPPPYALFVLLAPHPARMLPTVLSRCQLIRLAPAPVAEVAAYLAAQGIAPEKATLFAAYAEGRVGTALSIASRPGVEAEVGRVLDFAESIPAAAPLRALKTAELMRKTASGLKALTGEAVAEESAEEGAETGGRDKLGRRQLGTMLDLLVAFYRDLLALRLGGAEAAIVHADRRDRLAALAAGRDAQAWIRSLECLLAARRRVDQNASPRLLTEWLSVRLVLAR